MRHGWPVAAVVGLLLALAPGAHAQVEAGSKSVTSGQVTATLSWQADDSFAYQFTAYAFSAFPLRVLAYGTDRSGKTALRDVTAGYETMVAREAAEFRHQIPKYAKDDPRGVIAAYVADLYRLGRKAQANAYLRSALRRGLLKSPFPGPDIWPTNRRYIRDLKRFLSKHGYG